MYSIKGTLNLQPNSRLFPKAPQGKRTSLFRRRGRCKE